MVTSHFDPKKPEQFISLQCSEFTFFRRFFVRRFLLTGPPVELLVFLAPVLFLVVLLFLYFRFFFLVTFRRTTGTAGVPSLARAVAAADNSATTSITGPK